MFFIKLLSFKATAKGQIVSKGSKRFKISLSNQPAELRAIKIGDKPTKIRAKIAVIPEKKYRQNK